MDLKAYATKTEIIPRVNARVEGVWTIGIDYGFSGVKGFSPNKCFCFPNCAVKVDGELSLVDESSEDLILRDESGTWIVGEKAHSVITSQNAMNYESEMYERNRYFSPVFGALMKVGLGIAMTRTRDMAYNGEPIQIQTGLPPEYLDLDTPIIKEALAGDYDFEIKIGKGGYRRFQFHIEEKDIYVMSQPKGSLFSAFTRNDGTRALDDMNILRRNTLVFDPGFKTLDTFFIQSGIVTKEKSNTFDTLGMREIFSRTSDELKKLGATVKISEMQKYLKSGYVKTFDRKHMRSQKVEFGEILYKQTEAVCMEAIQKLISIYDYMQDIDYMIITGGTGNAWEPIIRNFFAGMEGLTILSANRYDPELSNTYSNVRGYYLSLVANTAVRLRNARKEAAPAP